MRRGYLSKIPLLLVSVIFLFTVGGVFANWFYANSNASPVTKTLPVTMSKFEWTGSDIFPDVVGNEDHMWLINNIVFGNPETGSDIGLNNPNSQLNEFINNRLQGGWFVPKRQYFGSMAARGNEEIEELFGIAAQGLSFIIYVVSDTQYYLYTTDVYLGKSGETNWAQTSNKTPGNPSIPLGEYIYPVYRTLLTRPNTSSDWTIVESKRGKAMSAWYEESRNTNITQIPSFNPTTWGEDVMGESMTSTEAIITFVGDNPVAYSYGVPVYYRITPKTSASITVNMLGDGYLNVYNSSGTKVAGSSKSVGNDGSITLSAQWQATANQLYYIEVECASNVAITIN